MTIELMRLLTWNRAQVSINKPPQANTWNSGSLTACKTMRLHCIASVVHCHGLLRVWIQVLQKPASQHITMLHAFKWCFQHSVPWKCMSKKRLRYACVHWGVKGSHRGCIFLEQGGQLVGVKWSYTIFIQPRLCAWPLACTQCSTTQDWGKVCVCVCIVCFCRT